MGPPMRPIAFVLCVLLTAVSGAACADEAPRLLPAPVVDNPLAAGDSQTAVLAGGCYWGMQEIFEHIKGVQQVVAGFTGPRASSDEDDLMRRGHVPAESVKITFDPAQISYGQILRIFFSVAHDPTQVNRQDPDTGPQYRSVVFYTDDTQQKIAQAYIAQLGKAHAFDEPIATQIDSLDGFHRVGDSQQDFAIKHPTLSYIVDVDLPRLAALKNLFPALYLQTPITLSSN
jgi:peptide-methionine (S)-S-oxide reductase